MSDFTIRLEQVFQGPMDLLLHLVREQEVEIHEVQIHRIIEGYLAYLESLPELDLETAGDFLVMAATLMAIKSRSLLPQTDVDLDDDLDPGDELIQRLIDYRRYKVFCEALEARAERRALLHGRGFRGELSEHREEALLDLGDLTAFDLLAAWSRLLRETTADKPHQIAADPRPLRFYVETVVQRVRAMSSTTLRSLLDDIEGGPTRESLIGSFCALLELCRLGVIGVEQEGRGADIAIRLKAAEDELEGALAGLRLEEEERAAEEAHADAGDADRGDDPDDQDEDQGRGSDFDPDAAAAQDAHGRANGNGVADGAV